MLKQLLTLCCFILLSPSITFANVLQLPNNLKVYIQGNQVSRTPVPGYEEKHLPVNNDYQANPACYVACYSRNKNTGVYMIDKTTYINGMVRVAGIYHDRECMPGTEEELINICKKIPTCMNEECWVGGDTGALYGIKEKPKNRRNVIRFNTPANPPIN